MLRKCRREHVDSVRFQNDKTLKSPIMHQLNEFVFNKVVCFIYQEDMITSHLAQLNEACDFDGEYLILVHGSTQPQHYRLELSQDGF